MIPLDPAIQFLMKSSKNSTMHRLLILLKEQRDNSSLYFKKKLIMVYGLLVLLCQINTSLMIPKAHAAIIQCISERISCSPHKFPCSVITSLQVSQMQSTVVFYAVLQYAKFSLWRQVSCSQFMQQLSPKTCHTLNKELITIKTIHK